VHFCGVVGGGLAAGRTRAQRFLGKAALLQFVAEDLLRGLGEVVDLSGEFSNFDVAHFAVVRGESAPFFHGVCGHGEQYSGWWFGGN